MKKVLLFGFILVVAALGMVAGAFIYTTWFDNRQEIEAHIVADEDMPNMTKEDVKALFITHVLTQLSPDLPGLLACEKGSSEESVRYTGEGTWIVKFGSCAVTVDDRTGKVSP